MERKCWDSGKRFSFLQTIRLLKYPCDRTDGENCMVRYVASGPLVRSSYKAGEFFIEAMLPADRNSARAGAAT